MGLAHVEALNLVDPALCNKLPVVLIFHAFCDDPHVEFAAQVNACLHAGAGKSILGCVADE